MKRGVRRMSERGVRRMSERGVPRLELWRMPLVRLPRDAILSRLQLLMSRLQSSCLSSLQVGKVLLDLVGRCSTCLESYKLLQCSVDSVGAPHQLSSCFLLAGHIQELLLIGAAVVLGFPFCLGSGSVLSGPSTL